MRSVLFPLTHEEKEALTSKLPKVMQLVNNRAHELKIQLLENMYFLLKGLQCFFANVFKIMSGQPMSKTKNLLTKS